MAFFSGRVICGSVRRAWQSVSCCWLLSGSRARCSNSISITGRQAMVISSACSVTQWLHAAGGVELLTASSCCSCSMPISTSNWLAQLAGAARPTQGLVTHVTCGTRLLWHQQQLQLQQQQWGSSSWCQHECFPMAHRASAGSQLLCYIPAWRSNVMCRAAARLLFLCYCIQ